jgi:Ni2+-binding GTPase involved in maturation of urease and hydrogenase
MFKQATKQQSRLRMTIDGPAGSGKTFTALTSIKPKPTAGII